jgi:hypothetical protein
MLVHHVLNADTRAAFLARLGEKDDIAIERARLSRLSSASSFSDADRLSLSSTVHRP